MTFQRRNSYVDRQEEWGGIRAKVRDTVRVRVRARVRVRG
jgi:hypothetical protein